MRFGEKIMHTYVYLLSSGLCLAICTYQNPLKKNWARHDSACDEYKILLPEYCDQLIV